MQRVLGILFYPLIALVALLLRILPRRPYHYYPLLDRLFVRMRVYPVPHHFYTPFVIPGRDFDENAYQQARDLPAIDFHANEQLLLLKQFSFQKELLELEAAPTVASNNYSFTNDTFAGGDGEMYYNMIRHFQPARVMEVGSGHSSRMALNALSKNRSEYPARAGNLTCIEPFSNAWLDQLGADIIRKKVEDLGTDFFHQLDKNDILFIDSTHVIRPGGDVLFEYLHLLPCLKQGVIIHVHDIFTPFHYPLQWIRERRMWNEQYLLEAFLSYNPAFRIIAANHYLFHFHKEEYLAACPVLKKNHSSDCGSSIWLEKIL